MKDMQQPSISGILLAAGLSTRMGQPKQLLQLGEKTIVETVVENMLNSKFNEVVVVLGHYANQIQDLLNEYQVTTIYNPNYRDGMLTSVQAGVTSLNFANVSNHDGNFHYESKHANRSAFSIMLVDQPFISSGLIDTVIDVYARTDKGIVLPSYKYKRGHPVIFHHKYTDDILALHADSKGVRSLYKLHSDDIHYVNVNTNAVLRDIDYKVDYENALNDYR